MSHLAEILTAALIGAFAYRLLLDWNARVRKRRARALTLPYCRECGHVDDDEPAHLGSWNNDGGFTP